MDIKPGDIFVRGSETIEIIRIDLEQNVLEYNWYEAGRMLNSNKSSTHSLDLALRVLARDWTRSDPYLDLQRWIDLL